MSSQEKPKPEGIELTIFGKGAGANGQDTLMFYGVKFRNGMIADADGVIMFSYVSHSTGKTKNATFFQEGIMGYSVEQI